jgi:hypothetical protein
MIRVHRRRGREKGRPMRHSQGIGRLGGQALGLGFEAALAAAAGTAAALGDMLTATATGGSGLIDIVP